MSVGAPAGWYPHGDKWETYWDGSAWTGQHRRKGKSGPPRFTFGVVLTIIGVGLAVWVIIATTANREDAPPTPEELRVSAARACEGAVDQNLKAPSTAQHDNSVTGAGPWTVTGTVDAQNSFGATIRSRYLCTVTLDGDVMNAYLEQLG